MKGYEERIYKTAKTKPNNVNLKTQLVRLTSDLERYTATGASPAIISALRSRIRDIRQQIAAAETEGERRRPSADAAEIPDAAAVYATTARYAPRSRG